jgi:hypothetical protein
LDLVSARWLEALAGAVSTRGSIFYTALTYDGVEQWAPPHRADAEILEAFHQHQGGDKGFGRAAGPKATDLLARAFSMAGYEVQEGGSPWILDRADAALIRHLADGIATAVLETKVLPDAVVADWREARHAAGTCRVGHLDLLAAP